MRRWLLRLNTRERLFLGGGALVLLALLVYALAWEPFAREHQRLRQVVGDQRELVRYLESAAGELAETRAQARPRATPQPGQSLLALVDATARQGGLASGLTRVQPEGADQVRVWLDKVAFNALMAWLAGLSSQHGAEVDQLAVEAADAPGLVNVRLTVVRPTAGGA